MLMRVGFISINLLFFFNLSGINSLTTAAPDLACGTVICYQSQGICNNNTTCVCNTTYDTYPEDSTVMCNYKKKSQLLAFILELFVTFGAGHFYTLNLKMAIPKVLFWFLGYSLFIILRIINKKKDENNPTMLMISLWGCLTCTIMVIWQIVDIFMFALNGYQDGYGIDLQSW
jgi:hypothetical protein